MDCDASRAKAMSALARVSATALVCMWAWSVVQMGNPEGGSGSVTAHCFTGRGEGPQGATTLGRGCDPAPGADPRRGADPRCGSLRGGGAVLHTVSKDFVHAHHY